MRHMVMFVVLSVPCSSCFNAEHSPVKIEMFSHRVWLRLCYCTSPSPSSSSLALLFSLHIDWFPKTLIAPSQTSHWAHPKSVNSTTCQVPRALLPVYKAPVCLSLFALIHPETYAHVLAGVIALISHCSQNVISIQSVFPSGKNGEEASTWKKLLKSCIDTEEISLQHQPPNAITLPLYRVNKNTFPPSPL